MGPVWRLWRSFQWCRELLQRNARVKATLETYICWCPFGSDIRKNGRRDTIRMSEPGHHRRNPVDPGRKKGAPACAGAPQRSEHCRVCAQTVVLGMPSEEGMPSGELTCCRRVRCGG